MSRHDLIAYIPTLNARHLEWFKRHPDSRLYLISQGMAERFLPRLSRNLAAMPTKLMVRIIESQGLVRSVEEFYPNSGLPPDTPETAHHWVLPDEDISRVIAERYLKPDGQTFEFEMIWARYDMQALKAEQPVIAGVEISEDELDREFMSKAISISERSPDWWRRVGAVLVDDDGVALAAAFNTHMPSEYETYIFGDPAINRDAGQQGKSCSLHAEDAAITLCAKHGLETKGGSIYVSTFPCESCARKIAFAGISRVYFSEGYSSLNAQEIFRSRGIRIIRVQSPGL